MGERYCPSLSLGPLGKARGIPSELVKADVEGAAQATSLCQVIAGKQSIYRIASTGNARMGLWVSRLQDGSFAFTREASGLQEAAPVLYA